MPATNELTARRIAELFGTAVTRDALCPCALCNAVRMLLGWPLPTRAEESYLVNGSMPSCVFRDAILEEVANARTHFDRHATSLEIALAIRRDAARRGIDLNLGGQEQMPLLQARSISEMMANSSTVNAPSLPETTATSPTVAAPAPAALAAPATPERTFTCVDCGFESTYPLEFIRFQRQPYCRGCVTICECCGDAIPLENMEGEVCTACVDEGYARCENCSAWVNDFTTPDCDPETSVCHSCAEEMDNAAQIEDDREQAAAAGIHSHDYKPRAKFLKAKKETVGNRTLYFGLEVETERAKSRYDISSALGHVGISRQNAWYAKRDGSLSDGIEMVSHPGTFQYWTKEGEWDMLAGLRKIGFRSYDTRTCGLHVHVSRSALSAMDIFKLLRFFRKNYRWLMKLSRRETELLEQWAAISGVHHSARSTAKQCDKIFISKAKGARDGVRYQAINLEPSKTIEFRLFRGTLNVDTIKDVLCFLYTLILFVKDSSLDNMQEADYRAYLAKNGTRLLGKMAHSNLEVYINEAVKVKVEA